MTSIRTRAIANRLARGILTAGAASVCSRAPPRAERRQHLDERRADIVNQYYFRGIVQETGGFIMQPYLDASISFGAASITAGTWSSLHSRGDAGFAGAPESFYETDFYAGIGGRGRAGRPRRHLHVVHEPARKLGHDQGGRVRP